MMRGFVHIKFSFIYILILILLLVNPISGLFVKPEHELDQFSKEGDVKEFNITISDVPSYAKYIAITTDLEYYNEKPLISLKNGDVIYNVSNPVIPIDDFIFPVTGTISGRVPHAMKQYKCGPNELIISIPPSSTNTYEYYDVFLSSETGEKKDQGISQSFKYYLPNIEKINNGINALDNSWDKDFAQELFSAGLIDFTEKFVELKKPGLPIIWVLLSILTLILGFIIGNLYANSKKNIY